MGESQLELLERLLTWIDQYGHEVTRTQLPYKPSLPPLVGSLRLGLWRHGARRARRPGTSRPGG